jgi:hypothetical protein
LVGLTLLPAAHVKRLITNPLQTQKGERRARKKGRLNNFKAILAFPFGRDKRAK